MKAVSFLKILTTPYFFPSMPKRHLKGFDPNTDREVMSACENAQPNFGFKLKLKPHFSITAELKLKPYFYIIFLSLSKGPNGSHKKNP